MNDKILLFGAAALLLFGAAACSDDASDSPSSETEAPALLISPRIDVRMADPLSQNSFTGILEVYPCSGNGSLYYGNYLNGKLTVFSGYYTIVDGEVFGSYNRELHLPTGDYNMIYWGTPRYDEPIHNAPQIVSPGLTQGADLSQLYFALRPIDDEVYSPVYDLVHAVRPAHVGTDALQASLSRIGSGLKVTVRQSDGSPFPTEITHFGIRIGNIAERVDFYTAEASNMTKTVAFDLTRSDDGLTYSNPTVMLFPSAANPPLEIRITLADGTEHRMSQNLSSTLSPNTRLTLELIVGKILPEEAPGDITIEDWNEESETIEFPIVD